MIHIGGSSDGTDSIPGVETTTIITAIIVPLSCVVSFIIGVLVGAVVHYCAVRRKHTVDTREKPTVALSQLKEKPDAVYEDVSDLPSSGDIDLKENATYAYVQH